jgi:hypothetical protein
MGAPHSNWRFSWENHPTKSSGFSIATFDGDFPKSVDRWIGIREHLQESMFFFPWFSRLIPSELEVYH